MDKLPTEILGVILYWEAKLCKCEKNTLLPLRLVCKAFDAGLRPYIFKCIQLEFSRFSRDHPRLDEGALERVGRLAEAVYVDVMVVRDEEEIDRLSQVFQGLIPKVPEMVPLLESLRQYCMNENTFDETDYRRLVETALAHTPNMTRLKVNLPFQVVGQQSRTATLLLGNTMASLRNRPEEFKCVQHLVLDHVSDTSLIDLCNNHLDLGNAMHVFKGLKHLVMSIKRQETRYSRQNTFAQNLWILIEKATGLRTLCLVGWNVRRNISTRVHVHGVQQQIWNMRSMPFTRDVSEKLVALQALELKRVDMDPQALFSLLKQLSNTLLEVYLNEVYLKVRSTQAGALGNTSLWIGYPGLPKPENCCWLAEDLYHLETLNLTVLRVTGLGYDEFEPTVHGSQSEYDLKDPSSQNRSFDERFVKAVMEGPDPIIMETINNLVENPPIWPPITSTPLVSPSNSRPPSSDSSDPPSSETREARRKEKAALHRRMLQYDCDTTQRYHNTTSYFKRCIDGWFFNHNEQALKELQNIIQVADRGMNLLQTEIDRAREEHRDIAGAPAMPQPANGTGTATASGSTTTAGTMTGTAGSAEAIATNGTNVAATSTRDDGTGAVPEGATINPALLNIHRSGQ